MKTNKIHHVEQEEILSPLSGIVLFETFENLYTASSEAFTSLTERRKDVSLKKSTKELLGEDGEEFLKYFKQPRSVIFRQVATPNHEVLRFLRLSKEMGLKPLIFEYHGDKFVSSGNHYKRSLGKMPLYQYTGKDGRDMVNYHTVCDFNVHVGKPIAEATCMTGESLVDFHHNIFRKMTGLNPKTHCVDATKWFKHSPNGSTSYYEEFLSLFVRDGILFENFFPFKEENGFTQKIIVPAFKHIEAKTGKRPLIVRLTSPEEEARTFWDMYPKKIEKFLKQ